MRIRKKFVSIVAVFGVLSLAGAAQASAAVWSPAGGTFLGTTAGTGSFPQWTLGNLPLNYCNFSTVELKTASPLSAEGTAAGPTGIKFGGAAGAEGDCAGATTTSVSTAGTWKFKANSTSSVTITIPAGGMTVTKWSDSKHMVKMCDYKVNAASPVSATWSNSTRRLTLKETGLPVTKTNYAPAHYECYAFGELGTMYLREYAYQFPAGLQIS